MKVLLCFEILAILLYLLIDRTTQLKNKSWQIRTGLLLIMALVVLVRVYKFWLTMGLDLDEAMGGYNAWSISKYGVDMMLKPLPVYFYAWGSGMNALYLYLAIPFIKLFGLTLSVYRLPMVLFSILAAFYFLYALLKTNWKDSNIIILMIILFLSPAMITSSRWAVESNIFPSLVVVATATMILFLSSEGWKKSLLFVLYNVFLGISAYAYSNNWLFLACATLLVYGWLIFTKKVNIKQVVIGVTTILLLVWPLALFMYVNYISHKELQVLGLTITKMAISRGSSQFALGNGVVGIWNNIVAATTMMVTGNDGMVRVELPIFGPFYPFMLVFAIVGLFKKVSSKFNDLDTYMLLLLLASIPTFILILPNFVHYNAMFVPILYFEYVGLQSILDTKFMKVSFLVTMAVLLSLFAKSYLVTNAAELHDGGIEVSSDVRNAIDATHKFKDKKVVFVTRYGKQYYPVVLFYEHISPEKFFKTREKLKPADHLEYSYFDKYYFEGNLDNLKISKNRVYIVQNNVGLDLSKFSKSKSEIYGTYTVYYY